MTGQVATIQSILDQDKDHLADILSQLYHRWYIQRITKEEEWKELRNYIFATDTSTTSNSSLPWKNKTTIPN